MKSQAHSLPGGTGKVARSGNREVVAERQGKVIYLSEKPDYYIQAFCANGKGDEKKYPGAKQLAVLRNEISSYLFEYLDGFHIPTHFAEKCSDTEMLVHRTEPFPLLVKIFNFGTGALSERLGFPPGSSLEYPIIEHYYCNGLPEPSWVNEHHLYAMKILAPEEFKHIGRIAAKVNVVLRSLCDRRQLVLSDLHLSFGRLRNQIVLVDELSPVTCRFLDATTRRNDSNHFSPDAENAATAFAELSARLQLKRV